MRKLTNIESIEFKDVSLSYDHINTILDKISFRLEKQTQVAIVGKSGTGKTSLVNLIPRFYELKEGTIYINGIDYTEYSLQELRKNIAYVFQEPVIFEMSIADNIRYGNSKDITIEQIKQVCQKNGLDKKINQFENEYDTMISAKTDCLFYGEKQLLSFARAILKQADLILLDEVTSNLDLEFENEVMEATKEMLKDKFSFVIAHRLNTIKNADLILFLEDAKIVEVGTHEELLSKKGHYYDLCTNNKAAELA